MAEKLLPRSPEALSVSGAQLTLGTFTHWRCSLPRSSAVPIAEAERGVCEFQPAARWEVRSASLSAAVYRRRFRCWPSTEIAQLVDFFRGRERNTFSGQESSTGKMSRQTAQIGSFYTLSIRAVILQAVQWRRTRRVFLPYEEKRFLP